MKVSSFKTWMVEDLNSQGESHTVWLKAWVKVWDQPKKKRSVDYKKDIQKVNFLRETLLKWIKITQYHLIRRVCWENNNLVMISMWIDNLCITRNESQMNLMWFK